MASYRASCHMLGRLLYTSQRDHVFPVDCRPMETSVSWRMVLPHCLSEASVQTERCWYTLHESYRRRSQKRNRKADFIAIWITRSCTWLTRTIQDFFGNRKRMWWETKKWLLLSAPSNFIRQHVVFSSMVKSRCVSERFNRFIHMESRIWVTFYHRF